MTKPSMLALGGALLVVFTLLGAGAVRQDAVAGTTGDGQPPEVAVVKVALDSVTQGVHTRLDDGGAQARLASEIAGRAAAGWRLRDSIAVPNFDASPHQKPFYWVFLVFER